MLEIIICIAAGYLFGCVSCGYIVGKLHHTDIRTLGSGNAGTTNVLRNFGAASAAVTFAGDLLKAVVPILLIRFAFDTQTDCYLLCLYCGLGVVLGHNYPFYLGFKGGKGIAVTSAVVMSAAHPVMIPIGLAIFLAAAILTRYVSVGSLLVAWYIPANTLVFHNQDADFIHMMIISLLFTAFAYFQHRENISRLIHGNENKLWKTKREKEVMGNEQG